MIIEVDAGNSFVKWRLVSLQSRTVLSRDIVATSDIARYVFPSGASHAFVSCVASRDVRQQLDEALRNVTDHPPLFVQSLDRVGRIRNGYQLPEMLGVDRWLAILAAGHLTCRPFVVFDAGSALTADIVDGQGLHLGGYIVPGLSMMRRSLCTDTHGVRLRETDVNSLAAGDNTERAVNRGLMIMVGAFVDHVIDRAQLQIRENVTVYLTGGDAGALMKVIDTQACYVPDLVLDGLAVAVQK